MPNENQNNPNQKNPNQGGQKPDQKQDQNQNRPPQKSPQQGGQKDQGQKRDPDIGGGSGGDMGQKP